MKSCVFCLLVSAAVSCPLFAQHHGDHGGVRPGVQREHRGYSHRDFDQRGWQRGGFENGGWGGWRGKGYYLYQGGYYWRWADPAWSYWDGSQWCPYRQGY